jgi:Cof subfamily protein (haloacid dehalogenase superfamily)
MSPRPGLIAIDLDGTLLGTDGVLTDRSVAAVRAVAAAGWYVVLATGRPPAVVTPFADRLGGAVSHVVATNGSLVTTFPDRPGAEPELLDALSFDLDAARAIVTALRGFDPRFGFALATDAGFGHETGFAVRMPAEVPDPPIDDVLALGGRIAFKLFSFHPERSAHDLVTALPATLDDLLAGTPYTGMSVSHMGADAVEIGPGDIDKRAALERLCGRLGVDRADVVAFGDEWNDLTMLRWAGRGIAMENAAPEVRAVADEIAPHHADDGVARVLERLLRTSPSG